MANNTKNNKTYIKALITSSGDEIPRYVKDGVYKFSRLVNRHIFMCEKMKVEISTCNIKIIINEEKEFNYTDILKLLIKHNELDARKTVEILHYLEWRTNLSAMCYENGNKHIISNTIYGTADEIKQLIVDDYTLLDINITSQLTIDTFSKLLSLFNELVDDEWSREKPEDRAKLILNTVGNKISIYVSRRDYNFAEYIAAIYCSNNLLYNLEEFYYWLRDNSTLEISNCGNPYDDYPQLIDWEEFDSRLQAEITYIKNSKTNR